MAIISVETSESELGQPTVGSVVILPLEKPLPGPTRTAKVSPIATTPKFAQSPRRPLFRPFSRFCAGLLPLSRYT